MLLTVIAILAEAAAPAAAPLAVTAMRPAPTATPHPLSCACRCLSPVEAVTYASYLGDKAGVAGTFDMPVAAVGQQNGLFYLNSENDYRDRNCLTVAMKPTAMLQFLGTVDPDQVRRRLRNHRIVVRGVAQRVRIALSADGRASDKYYYQVHVRISDASQIRMTT